MTCRGPAISVNRTGSLQEVRRVPATVEQNIKTTQRMAGTLHEDLHTFLITPRSFILRMRRVSDKWCTHFVFNNFSLNNRAVYEIMWQNMVERGRPQITKQKGACALHATNTHWEYVILIAFPLPQWFHESASMLCYTHTACHNNSDEQTCATNTKNMLSRLYFRHKSRA
jgi:hypothetical protein